MLRLFDHIPAACPLCEGRVSGTRLCVGCLLDLDQLERDPTCVPRCCRCGLRLTAHAAPCWPCQAQPPAFTRTHVAMPYAPPYDTLVGRLKLRRQLWVASCLANLLARAAGPDSTPDLLIPIPSSVESLTRRGFNPAGEIARALGKALHVPVQYTMLARNRDGPKQSQLGRTRRLIESVDLFRARSSLAGLHVGVVDDVMTTGGTLEAASQAVLDKDAKSVSVFVVARRAD